MRHYDPATALIVVDVQNDFAHPDGALYVRDGESIVGSINQHMADARRAGALVVCTQDWHPARTPHFVTDGGVWPPHCVADTWGAELFAELDHRGPVVRKGTAGEDGYSGFSVRHAATGEESRTELAALVRSHGATEAVVVGLATDYCVKATALDAVTLGLTTTVLTDLVRAVNLQPGDGDRALAELAAAGVHVRPSTV